MGIDFTMVAIAALFYFLAGWFWYPLMFRVASLQNASICPTGKTVSHTKKTYFYSYLLAFGTCTSLAYVFSLNEVNTLSDALMITPAIWFGFVFMTNLYATVYEARPLKRVLIDSGYHLLGMGIATVVLTLWG